MPAMLEPLDNLGYVIKMKGKNQYVVNDHAPIISDRVWGNDLAEIKVYKSIQEAQGIKRNFDNCKSDYHNIKNIEIEVQIMHKKKIMIAKLKGSKDE